MLVVLLALGIVASGAAYNLYADYKTTQAKLATAEAKGTGGRPSPATVQGEAGTPSTAEAYARATAKAAQSTATAAARIAEEAKMKNCDAPIDLQSLSLEPRTQVAPPSIFAYAVPFDIKGIGPFSVKGGESKLFHYHPIGIREDFVFVKCLFLYASIPSSPDGTPTTLDFSLWSPISGGWGINGGRNKLNWGENTIEISYPDSLVSTQGDVYFSIRNYGGTSRAIEQVNLTLWLVNPDATYTVIKPASK